MEPGRASATPLDPAAIHPRAPRRSQGEEGRPAAWARGGSGDGCSSSPPPPQPLRQPWLRRSVRQHIPLQRGRKCNAPVARSDTLRRPGPRGRPPPATPRRYAVFFAPPVTPRLHVFSSICPSNALLAAGRRRARGPRKREPSPLLRRSAQSCRNLRNNRQIPPRLAGLQRPPHRSASDSTARLYARRTNNPGCCPNSPGKDRRRGPEFPPKMPPWGVDIEVFFGSCAGLGWDSGR